MRQEEDESTEAPPPSRVGRTWGKRILVAIGVGVAIGAVGGVMAVNTLEPGRPGQPDSLQLLLDSVANARTASSDSAQSPRDTVITPPATDTVATAGTIAVPNLADVEEGDARALLEDLGFDVGDIIFRASPKPAGTVLSTFPVAGERVVLPVTINLVLSDGRGRRDSADASSPRLR